MGPMTVSRWRGSPTLRDFMASARWYSKSSAIEAWTRNRLAAMQDWPGLRGGVAGFGGGGAGGELGDGLGVGVVEDDERVGAAELEDDGLERLSGGAGHG